MGNQKFNLTVLLIVAAVGLVAISLGVVASGNLYTTDLAGKAAELLGKSSSLDKARCESLKKGIDTNKKTYERQCKDKEPLGKIQQKRCLLIETSINKDMLSYVKNDCDGVLKPAVPKPRCGDGICDKVEKVTCPKDCPQEPPTETKSFIDLNVAAPRVSRGDGSYSQIWIEWIASCDIDKFNVGLFDGDILMHSFVNNRGLPSSSPASNCPKKYGISKIGIGKDLFLKYAPQYPLPSSIPKGTYKVRVENADNPSVFDKMDVKI